MTVLPGSFDPGRLERLNVSVGRCTICDLDSAVFINKSTGTKLCENCYQLVGLPPDKGVAGE